MRVTMMLLVGLSMVLVVTSRHAEGDSTVGARLALAEIGYADGTTRQLHRLLWEPRPVATSALPPRHLDERVHPVSLVPRHQIVSGGPAPDAIPSIDHPRFHAVGDIEWLDDREAVLALGHGGQWRAYPVAILVWHEIVNDVVGGDPVVVTYCPICNSATAFLRTLDGRVLDLGTSGAVYSGALVMYDRQTESLWTHFDGRAVVGTLVGDRLQPVRIQMVSFGEFRQAHPDGLVLDRRTGYDRDHGANPYQRFHTGVGSAPFTYAEVDPRLDERSRVVGLRATIDRMAVLREVLERERVMHLTLDGRPVVVWHRPGLAFPVDAGRVADGTEVGATSAYFVDTLPEGTRFDPVDGDVVDRATGTRWDGFGRAVSGPLAGLLLEAVDTLDTRWFAWSAYHPDTQLVTDVADAYAASSS